MDRSWLSTCLRVVVYSAAASADSLGHYLRPSQNTAAANAQHQLPGTAEEAPGPGVALGQRNQGP